MTKTTKITAFSYSRLSDYERCPRFFKFKHVERRYEPKSPHMQRGIDIHNEAEKFLCGETDLFPDSCANYEEEFYEARSLRPIVEQKWAFDRNWRPVGFFDKSVYVRIIMDMCLPYPDGTLDVIDLKTGKLPYGDDQTYRDQMRLFSVGGYFQFRRDGIKKVTTRLWYLDHDAENAVEEDFSEAQILEFKEEFEDRAEPMFNDNAFAPRPNDKCRFCHWRASNGGPCEFG